MSGAAKMDETDYVAQAKRQVVEAVEERVAQEEEFRKLRSSNRKSRSGTVCLVLSVVIAVTVAYLTCRRYGVDWFDPNLWKKLVPAGG